MVVGELWTIAALVIAGCFALMDWWAVANRHRNLEYLAKPGMTAACLVAAALSPAAVAAQRWWWIAAFFCCLLGDIFLMWDRWTNRSHFLPGLGSFLVGHILFVLGFAARGWSNERFVVAAVLAAIVGIPVLILLIRGAIAKGRPEMVVPLCAYVGVIIAMTSGAVGTGVVIAAVGAVCFMISDSMIGISRFIRPFPGHDLAIIVTYHLALIALVLSLRP